MILRALQLFSAVIWLSATVCFAAPAPETIHDRFIGAVKEIRANNFGRAAELLTEVQNHAYRMNYANLPNYSSQLLLLAQDLYQQGKSDESRFLVHQALLLSPTDGKIHLASLAFHSVRTFSDTMSSVVTTVGSLLLLPTAGVAILVNGISVVLVAATLALFLVCAVQLIIATDAILLTVGRALPFRYRRNAPALITAVLYLLPLALGVLPALVGWSLTLGWFTRHCKRLGMVCGLLVLSWGVAIPFVADLSELSRDRTMLAVEHVARGDYDEQFLERFIEASRAHPDVPVLEFVRGSVLFDEQQYLPAKKILESVVTNEETPPAVVIAARTTLGAIAYHLGQFEEAKNELLEAERLGGNSRALYVNSAEVASKLYDAGKYREYYQKVIQIKGEASILIGGGEQERSQVFRGTLPTPFLYRWFLFSGPTLLGSALELDANEHTLGGVLMMGGSSSTIVVAGILTLIVAAIIGVGAKRRRIWSSGSFETRSRVWSIIPGGRHTAGQQPTLGAGAVAIVLVPLLCADGSPLRLVEVGVVHILTPWFCFIIAALLSVLFSWYIAADHGTTAVPAREEALR